MTWRGDRTRRPTRSSGWSGTCRGSRTTTSPASPAPPRPGTTAGATASSSRSRPATTVTATRPSSVGQVRASAELLTAYYDEVSARTAAYVAGLGPDDLDVVVDEQWDPPVTLGVRLVSVVNEVNQHVGQASYLRGLLDRR